MLAAVFAGPGRLELEDRPEPLITTHDEVLLEVEACGICGSDLQALAVPPGHPTADGVIMGHEFVARVVATGSAVTSVAPGDRVVVDPDPKCGTCRFCIEGNPAACENIHAIGVYRDGGLARFCVAPASTLFKIAHEIAPEIAALAEPLACVVNGARKAALVPGETALIIGGGAIGCMFTALFRASGARRIVVVEPMATRRTIALECGATAAVDPAAFERDGTTLLPGGADVVVDAVGSALETALASAAMAGRIVLFGMNDAATVSVRPFDITHRSLSILGSYVTHFTFPGAVRLIEADEDRFRPIVTHSLALPEVRRALELLRSGEAVKVVLVP